MSHYITEPCIKTKDTACVDVCPVDCIHPRKDEPDFEQVDQLFIDKDTCIDCGLCVDECPVKAIFPEDEVPAEWKHYVPLNVAYYEKKAR
ncbi:MAG: 4Fe-4S binding protein [Phycisphaerales bacterium]|nr:4Fe-4S binding protein [Phycisphaerales bacterium]